MNVNVVAQKIDEEILALQPVHELIDELQRRRWERRQRRLERHVEAWDDFTVHDEQRVPALRAVGSIAQPAQATGGELEVVVVRLQQHAIGEKAVARDQQRSSWRCVFPLRKKHERWISERQSQTGGGAAFRHKCKCL